MRRLGLAALLLLAACGNGSDPAPQETLRVDVVGAFDAAGSRTVLEGPRAVLTEATQVGLVALDGNGQVVPGLATSWRVSDDGLTYIFRLRPAKWADGREVRAGDIVAVYRRILDPASRHPLKPLLDRIENAADVAAGRKPPKALGVNDPLPNIVEIRLVAPQPAFLQFLAHPSMAIQRQGRIPPSLGAFEVVDAAARPLRLTRNAAYFDASAVALGGLELTPAEDVAAAILRFRRNATDVVLPEGLTGLAEARSVPLQGALRTEAAHAAYGYLVNAKGPLADRRVRRALAMAVNRSAAGVTSAAFPGAAPFTGIVPRGLPSYPAPAEPDWAAWTAEARLAEAARLLAEAGYGAARPLVVEVAIPKGPEHAALLASVARDWAALGVTTRALVRSPKGHAAALAKRDYALALVERTSPADSARFFLVPFLCRAQPKVACNREADRLLDSSVREPDLALRQAAVRQAEQLLIDDVVMIPLLVPLRWALVHPRVAGWTDNTLGAHPLSRLDVLPDTER